MKKTALLISILFGATLLSTIVLFSFFSANRLKSQLEQAKNMLQRTQEEVARLEQDKEKIAKDNERLKADAVSYVGLNTKLQNEKEKLQKDLQGAQKTIKTKETDLEKQRFKLKELEKRIEKDKTERQGSLLKAKEELQKKIASLEEVLSKERALYHYNLAVVYSQAGLYDEAVEAYEESLKFNPENAEAHYNLGLLYENFKKEPERAVEHYCKYIELQPDAADRQEVEAWINKLKGI